MDNNFFEKLRNNYRPHLIEVLFVGESRPQSGTFFYQGNSILYRETEKAFNEYFGDNIFNLDSFKNWNYWLYDICESPVNGLPDKERNAEIMRNIPRLEKFIESVNPKYIVVCKKGMVTKAILDSKIMNKYHKGKTIFFLPFPSNGRQGEYRKGLINIFKIIGLKKTE